MLGLLCFTPAIVFFTLAIVFVLAISNVHRLPKTVSLNIGSLNADDIRSMDGERRSYLRNQVAVYFVMAVIAAFLIGGVFFIVFGNTDSAWLILLGNLLGTTVGLSVALQVLKKANRLKVELL